jgi:hypothetical protein
MAQIISKDRKAYRIWDKVNNVWNQLNILTNAKSVDASDGQTLEVKVGAVNGITSDLACEDSSIAASAAALNQVNRNLESYPQFIIDDSTGQITGYTTKIGGADSVFPFSGSIKELTLAGGIITIPLNGVKSVSWNKIQGAFDNIRVIKGYTTASSSVESLTVSDSGIYENIYANNGYYIRFYGVNNSFESEFVIEYN